MSKITASSITGLTGAPNFTNGAVVTGVITSTTFSGITTSLNVTNPSIGIGFTTTPSDTFADGDGIVIYGTTNKTLTYSNTKKAFESNIPFATNESRFITGAEKITLISGNTVNLSYNSSSSNVGYCSNPTGDITLNVTGIPTTSDFDNHAVTFTVIVNSTGTARTCTAVNLNGVSRPIRWYNGSLSASLSGVANTIAQTIFSFTGINTVGSASTTSNYIVLGNISGGYW
jgi:hypothetical protein